MMNDLPLTYQENQAVQSRKWLILVAVNLFTFMSTLDASIVNIALPKISAKLSLAMAQTEWVATSYLMAICAAVLFFGKLGDSAGKIKVFKAGTFVFLLGSALCGFSTSLPFLIVSRVIQALGASITMANSMGIITDIFPAKERGRALGLIGTFVSLGSIAGPSIGGVIVSSLGWEYIFWVNIPVGLIAIAIAWRVLPGDLIRSRKSMDLPGSVLFAAFVLLLFAGLLLGQQVGYRNTWIIISLVLSAVVFFIFIWVEARRKEPLLQLSLFRNSWFSLSIFCGFLTFVSIFCFNIISPFYTQSVLHLTPYHAGFLLMLFPITMVIVAPLSGALSDKIGSELLTFAGLMVIVIALCGMASLHEGSSLTLVGTWTAMLGLGNGMFQSPNNSLIMSKVPRTELGTAGSINSLVRNIGMVVGITVATTTLFGVMSSKAGHHVISLIPGRPDIFLAGMHIVFSLAAGISLLAAVLTGWRLWVSRKKVVEA